MTAMIAHEQTLHDVETLGFAVVKTNPDHQSLTAAAVDFAVSIQAEHIGSMQIEGEGSGNWLLKHTEGIIFDEPHLLKYFALGCIVKATQGGATAVYDGREAAARLKKDYPEIVDTQTKYVSTVYAGQTAVHPLVVDTPEYGAALRYRSAAHTNQLLDVPDGMSDDEYYRIVDSVLDECVITLHNWQPGQLMIVNNHFTLHSRQPYVGRRVMQRFRFNDPNHPTILMSRRGAA